MLLPEMAEYMVFQLVGFHNIKSYVNFVVQFSCACVRWAYADAFVDGLLCNIHPPTLRHPF